MKEYCYPTLKVTDGKFTPFEGQEVGKVLPDGSIENTPYVYGSRSGRTIRGGVAITQHKSLERLDEGHLVNPATGDIFTETKSGNGYFNAHRRVFLKTYYSEGENE